jgi:o-succinylbenzoate---CoA ligase
VTLSIFDAARAEPERTAVITDDVELSFAALAARVERRLGELSDARGRPVLVVARPTLAVIERVLALFALGTPVLLGHPRATSIELEELARRAGAVMEPFGGGPGTAPPLDAFDPERIAALVPTSGTTGEPRIVLLSHRALLAAARASAENLGVDDDRWLLSLPLAHVGGLGVLVRSLLNRRAVVLFAPERSLLGELERFVAACERHRATLVSLVPTLLERLLEPPIAWRPPASLRAVLLGGAAIPRSLVARARARGIPVLPTYGMTETCAQIATARYASRLAPPPAGSDLFPSGPPLPGTEVRLVNGLLEVRSAALMSGYLGAPASAPRGNFHPTSDRAFIDDYGELTVTGRASDVIITGGENVDPLEVEAALTSLPGVRLAYVFGIPDATFGERVAALVVMDPGLDNAGAELKGLEQRLASFKLPRVIKRVTELPLTPSGKIDRRAARSLYGLAR